MGDSIMNTSNPPVALVILSLILAQNQSTVFNVSDGITKQTAIEDTAVEEPSVITHLPILLDFQQVRVFCEMTHPTPLLL